jgi:hypothetical protein
MWPLPNSAISFIARMIAELRTSKPHPQATNAIYSLITVILGTIFTELRKRCQTLIMRNFAPQEFEISIYFQLFIRGAYLLGAAAAGF